jgi:predicted ATPase
MIPSMSDPLLTRVRLRGYKSLATVDVELRPLTLLTGSGSVGKSNFIDALHLVADALNTSLERVLRNRGGLDAVRSCAAAPGDPVVVALDFVLDGLQPAASGHYEFTLDVAADGAWSVARESCRLDDIDGNEEASFEVVDGEVTASSFSNAPDAVVDDLYLTRTVDLPEMSPAFEALSEMRFYDFHPAQIARLSEHDHGFALTSEAGNLASVTRHLQESSPRTLERITHYLQRLLPNFEGLEATAIGDFDALDFQLRVAGEVRRFPIAAVSGTTLTALAVLVATLQPATDPPSEVTLVALEEPLSALPPETQTVLAEALAEAAGVVQVLITSRRDELAADPSMAKACHLAVSAEDGVTHIVRRHSVREATDS